ncbi:MAG TPA: trypsin-like peptidase domain-containing protein [Thermomicrobiales bacterium]|nr:trypsin-like peptidase domain-containing protein [Thermomicrobiales bacterium]
MDELVDWQARGLSHRLRAVILAIALVMGMLVFGGSATFAAVSSPNGTGSAAALAQTTLPNTQTSSFSVADVAAKANKAVVTVTNLQPVNNPFSNTQSGQPQPVGMGSGYIIDDAGHVVTNNHVVAGGTAFQVELYDGTTLDATLVGTDPFQDVAVLKLDLSNGQKVPATVSFGDSATVRQGDQVVAIGTPYGQYTNTVSEGIVGAVNRSLDTGDGYELPNLIQHSAPIYEGDSGGPLLNMQGQVIGMDVAKAVPQVYGGTSDANIGFAIASDAVKPIVDQIIKTGTVDRAYLGIQGQDQPNGQVVVQVQANSPAAKAGLQTGDVITAVDGQQIDAQHSLVNMLIFDHKPGDTIKLTVDRNGSTQQLTVTLGTRPANLQQ